MKFLSLLILLCSLACFTTAQQNAASIKQQMSAIRKSTNWEDPVAAKKANEQIRELSKKLMMTGNPQGELPKNLSEKEVEQAKKNAVDEKMKTWEQVMKSAAGGESADILLAEPVREEIKEEYRKEETDGINPAILSESTILILDFSLPVTQLLVSQMELFKSINTLIIIGVESTLPVDLNSILQKAIKYPLSELYIFGFQEKLKIVPSKVALFPELITLGLFCNQISVLPSGLIQLTKLKELHIDFNPIKTLQPINNLIKNLEVLSLKKTEIPQYEIDALTQKFPDCKILTE
jgi:Leucine-rich repeat (LRR) protein